MYAISSLQLLHWSLKVEILPKWLIRLVSNHDWSELHARCSIYIMYYTIIKILLFKFWCTILYSVLLNLWSKTLQSRGGALHDQKHSKHDFGSHTHHDADGRCLVLLPRVQCWRPHLSPGPRLQVWLWQGNNREKFTAVWSYGDWSSSTTTLLSF